MIYPTNDNILVKEVAKENKTASGLILTDDLETGSKPGMVVAVGPDADQTLLNNKVYLQWGKGMAVTDAGQQAVLISVEHVMGIAG